MDLTGDTAATLANDDEYLLRLERTLDNIARSREELANGNSPLVAHLAGYGLRDRLLAHLTTEPAARRDHGLFTDRHWSRLVTAVPERESEVDSTAQYIEKLILPNKDCQRQRSASTPWSRSSGRRGTRSATASTRASSRTSPCGISRRN